MKKVRVNLKLNETVTFVENGNRKGSFQLSSYSVSSEAGVSYSARTRAGSLEVRDLRQRVSILPGIDTVLSIPLTLHLRDGKLGLDFIFFVPDRVSIIKESRI